MKDSKPLNFPTIITIHNLFLLTMSAILAIGIGYFILQDILQNGFFHSICSAGNNVPSLPMLIILETHNNPYLHLFYYINYLLKYYEFVDTYIILLKKRPVHPLVFSSGISSLQPPVSHVTNWSLHLGLGLKEGRV